MININTILSAFQDKLTLLQWLKKVEEALNNATLSNVSVQQQAESTFKLKFEFEDGTSIESTDITIPQGETGNGISSIAKTSTSGYVDTYTITYTDGSTFNFTVTNGRDGEGIAATVEVGQTTTGEAGTQAMVENVGTPTNAVLKFTIPRGDKGDKGDPAEITADTLLDYLIGSTDITVDLDETGAKIEFRLDQTVIDKLDSIVPIEPNNGEATTQNLQSLKIGDTNFAIPQGGGGGGFQGFTLSSSAGNYNNNTSIIKSDGSVIDVSGSSEKYENVVAIKTDLQSQYFVSISGETISGYFFVGEGIVQTISPTGKSLFLLLSNLEYMSSM